MLVVATRRLLLARLMSAFARGGFSWRGVRIRGMGFALGAAGFVFVLADGRLEGVDFGLELSGVCARLGPRVAKQSFVVGGSPFPVTCLLFPVGCFRTGLGDYGTQAAKVVWRCVMVRGVAVGRGTSENGPIDVGRRPENQRIRRVGHERLLRNEGLSTYQLMACQTRKKKCSGGRIGEREAEKGLAIIYGTAYATHYFSTSYGIDYSRLKSGSGSI